MVNFLALTEKLSRLYEGAVCGRLFKLYLPLKANGLLLHFSALSLVCAPRVQVAKPHLIQKDSGTRE